MIVYFSGTGNSEFVARRVAKIVGDELISLNAAIKSGIPGNFHSEKPWVFVCPVYAWRMPRIVEDFIEKSTFTGSREAYVLMTCGESAGSAGDRAKILLESKGLTFLGFSALKMPENYIALFSAPDPEACREIIEKAKPDMDRLATQIKNRSPLQTKTGGVLTRLLGAMINPLFYRFIISAKGFHATDACTSCRACVDLCPLNNIELRDGKPVWGDHCTHCMACICRCPTEAIQYKKRCEKKRRYFLNQEEEV